MQCVNRYGWHIFYFTCISQKISPTKSTVFPRAYCVVRYAHYFGFVNFRLFVFSVFFPQNATNHFIFQ